MSLPNFLIVGAAKSGTTSLYHYLKQHPDVFLPSIKEPDFFASKHWKLPLHNIKGANPTLEIINQWDEYAQLFRGAKNELRGEASPSSLYYYSDSVPLIKEKLGNPKIIILLRNPVERAFSHYRFLKRDSLENLTFQEALQKEEQRKRQNFHYGYFYKSLGFYAKQVDAFMKEFDQVKVILFEDLKANTEETLRDIYRFLDLKDSFMPDLDVKYNPSGIPRSQGLHQFFRRKNKIRDILRPLTNMLISDSKKAKLLEKINKQNFKKGESLKAEDKAHLLEVYKEDIKKLAPIIRRDLDHWLSL